MDRLSPVGKVICWYTDGEEITEGNISQGMRNLFLQLPSYSKTIGKGYKTSDRELNELGSAILTEIFIKNLINEGVIRLERKDSVKRYVVRDMAELTPEFEYLAETDDKHVNIYSGGGNIVKHTARNIGPKDPLQASISFKPYTFVRETGNFDSALEFLRGDSDNLEAILPEMINIEDLQIPGLVVTDIKPQVVGKVSGKTRSKE